MHGNEELIMTKRIKSSDLVRARKETKRLQREANTRIRKAMKAAKRSGDKIELKKVQEIQKTFSNSLTPAGKTGLPKSYTHNVMWEKGRALDLKKVVNRSVLSKKKKQKITRRTFENLFGKEKTRELLNKYGGSEMNRMSNEFWDQMYKAQDMLYSAGIVPADEIMGRYGSIGSGLLKTGKQVVNDGYWSERKVIIDDGTSTDNEGEMPSIKMVAPAPDNDEQVETQDLATAIVKYYKDKYGIE